MKQYLSQQYKNAISKYKKFKNRFEKNIQNGVSNKKRRDLFQRLRRLYNQLTRLETQLKFAVSAGVLSLSLVALPQNEAVAQKKYSFTERKPLLLSKGLGAGNQLAPAFADLDNDGDLDLVIGNDAGSLSYYRNDTNDGSVDTTRYTSIPLSSDENPFKGMEILSDDYVYSTVPVFADIDSDGDQDLVLGHSYYYGYYSRIATFKNVDGKFVPFEGAANPFRELSWYEPFGFNDPAKPTFLDIDDDGDLDAFVGLSGYTSSAYTFVAFFENDNGTFVERAGTSNPLDAVRQNNTTSESIAFIDADNDGDLDVYASELYGDIKLFRNNAGIYVDAGVVPSLGSSSTYLPVISLADIDNDGDLDFVSGVYGYNTLPTGGYAGYVFTAKNNGDNTFATLTDIENDTTVADFKSIIALYKCSSIATADMDGDGDTDVLVADYYGVPSYFTQESEGVFEQKTGPANPFPDAPGVNVSVELGDLDADGDSDLVTGQYNGTLAYYRNNNGTFAQQTGASNPFNGIDVGTYSVPHLVDFDNDGDLDLVLGGRNNIRLYLNNAGVFVQEIGASNPFNSFTEANGYYAPKLKDMDGDNDLDLILGTSNGTVRYYTNDGGNIFEQVVTDSPFSKIKVNENSNIAFIDTDNDGDLDALVGEYDTGDDIASVYYYENVANTSCPKIDEIRHKINVNNSHSFTAQEFADVYNDLPDTKSKDFPKIKVITTPQFGTLTAGGSVVAPGTEILFADLGELKYTPNKDYTGIDAFTWAAYDAIGECYSAASYARFGIGVEVTAIDGDLGQYTKVYPNPTQNTFNIAFDKVINGKVELKLYNAVGALVKTYSYDTPANIQPINLENMPKGLYVLRITNDGKVGNIKVVKD